MLRQVLINHLNTTKVVTGLEELLLKCKRLYAPNLPLRPAPCLHLLMPMARAMSSHQHAKGSLCAWRSEVMSSLRRAAATLPGSPLTTRAQPQPLSPALMPAAGCSLLDLGHNPPISMDPTQLWGMNFLQTLYW